jgi:hypothetical protein
MTGFFFRLRRLAIARIVDQDGFCELVREMSKSKEKF